MNLERMRSEPYQTQQHPPDDTLFFGLDEGLVEELKVKAIAAKGRAYCRCYFFLHILFHLPRMPCYGIGPFLSGSGSI